MSCSHRPLLTASQQKKKRKKVPFLLLMQSAICLVFSLLLMENNSDRPLLSVFLSCFDDERHCLTPCSFIWSFQMPGMKFFNKRWMWEKNKPHFFQRKEIFFHLHLLCIYMCIHNRGVWVYVQRLLCNVGFSTIETN